MSGAAKHSLPIDLINDDIEASKQISCLVFWSYVLNDAALEQNAPNTYCGDRLIGFSILLLTLGKNNGKDLFMILTATLPFDRNLINLYVRKSD